MDFTVRSTFIHQVSSTKQQAGFSLIEVLVSIGIISVGLLGLAMTQAQGMKFGTGAYSRTQATIMAYNIIDRMRIHATEMRRQQANNADGSYYDYISSYEGDINSYFTGTKGDCVVSPITNPDALQTNFVNCWGAELLEVLPSASATMSIVDPTATPVEVELTISWIPRVVRETANAQDARKLTWSFQI